MKRGVRALSESLPYPVLVGVGSGLLFGLFLALVELLESGEAFLVLPVVVGAGFFGLAMAISSELRLRRRRRGLPPDLTRKQQRIVVSIVGMGRRLNDPALAPAVIEYAR